MVKQICVLIFLFFLSSSFSFKDQEDKPFFSNQSLHKSIETMLEYHVEYKLFSPLLAKRSFKLFVEQFDPHKMYLLHSEVDPFIHMTERKLEEVVQGHSIESYAMYESLNELIQKSIYRAREVRKAIRPLLLKQDLSLLEDDVDLFPKTLDDIKQKNFRRLALFLVAEKKWEEVPDFSEKQRNCLLDLWEERLARLEKPYLETRISSFFPMHVLKAFAKSLDAHSSFFSVEEAHDLKTTLEKQFEGIGIILREGVHGVVIKSLIKNSPAEKSGKIQKGDLLVAINKEEVAFLSYEEVLSRLKGGRGQKVFLKLKRSSHSQEEIVDVDLVREKVIMEEDRVRFSTSPFGKGVIGKIEVPSFYESEDGSSCVRDLKEAISKMRSEGSLLGIILDMRDNSGGFLTQAVKVSSLFMSGGVVVVSKYSQGQMQYLRNTDGKVFYQGPLVILTSKASASATEIVAQALQDYGIAVVVGDRRTYGKGSIQYQTVTGRNSSSYFKVTVGKYYTVSGRSTQIEGVQADIQVPTLYASYNIGEKYLSYPLKNDQIDSVFKDPLRDVKPSSRSWMKKNYLPHIQKKLSFWTELMPVLKRNSDYRIHHDKDFMQFLEVLQGGKKGSEKSGDSLGNLDLQMTEAVQIVKDMVFLESSLKKK